MDVLVELVRDNCKAKEDAQWNFMRFVADNSRADREANASKVAKLAEVCLHFEVSFTH